MSKQQLDSLIQMLKAQPIDPDASIEKTRAGFEQMTVMLPVEADVKCEPVSAGGVKAEWVAAPGADAGRAILYLHGGGYVIGSINTHRAMAGRISRAAKARVLLIDYRLAPEHPFPAAVEDSVAAYRYLLAQGIRPGRLAIAGDSAGGGLTIAALVAIKEAKLPMPAAGVGLSPWVDLEGIGASMTSKAKADPMVQKDGLLKMAAAYLNGKDPRSPLAAPLYADLSGLPPLLIQVGTAETLLDDSTRLAERARKSGVNVTLEPLEDMVHVWQVFAPMLDEGQQAIDKIGAFVLKHTA
ncbi:MAG TPA: alpha/beta hydrolase [Candidatus Binataceae bacterium]|nr:alpha/beta hydrolase [Candidatus Binataceae bacterium]